MVQAIGTEGQAVSPVGHTDVVGAHVAAAAVSVGRAAVAKVSAGRGAEQGAAVVRQAIAPPLVITTAFVGETAGLSVGDTLVQRGLIDAARQAEVRLHAVGRSRARTIVATVVGRTGATDLPRLQTAWFFHTNATGHASVVVGLA
jgi:hypothetical protein